eukprot:CAMPEP_0185351698 /NCGR_PEP_ID=MMETSP1364-20130426/3585_1 /TAXON_ID=38817 /ORGANISM="Gephyrocapsa oceanica, Strain RCC1303" /LENGTH=74 /DNA_ID=CAMNT_0027951267 /DNA_START=176 /DNA_END=400 /DNA_ORIENTATION=+
MWPEIIRRGVQAPEALLLMPAGGAEILKACLIREQLLQPWVVWAGDGCGGGDGAIKDVRLAAAASRGEPQDGGV